MVQKTAKCRQTRPKPRDLYTPVPVRGRVLARHIAGASNRQIAAEEGIDRETVGRILSQHEVVQMFAQYQHRLLAIVPKAIAAFEAALESSGERLRLAAATKLLEGLQVFHRGGIEQAADIISRAGQHQNSMKRCGGGSFSANSWKWRWRRSAGTLSPRQSWNNSKPQQQRT